MTESKFVTDPATAYQDLREHVRTIVNESHFWAGMVFAVFAILLLIGCDAADWSVTSLSICGIIGELYFIRVERPPVKNRNILRVSATLMLAFDPFERAVMLKHAQNDFSTEGRILARVLDSYTFGKPWVSRKQGRLVSSMLTTFKKRTVTCPGCGYTYDAVFDYTGSNDERRALICPNGDPLVVTLISRDGGLAVRDYPDATTTRLSSQAS